MKKILVAATLLTGASAAQAGFITVDNNPLAVANTTSVVSGNDFKDVLKNTQGVENYTLGASLGANVDGTVSFFYYGKEAGYSNQFKAGGIDFSTVYGGTVNKFGAPQALGSMEVTAGLLNFSFCAFSAPGSSLGCVTNLQNDGYGMSSYQSIAMSVTDSTAWLFWDDSGAGPDDNHDDMIIKAVFTPKSVPEPATFGLLALGLLGVGMSRRNANKK